MSQVRFICADVMAGLAQLPDESVHCVVTSPPYWGLRDYGVEGQIGLEPTIGEYIERLAAVFREVRRVLRGDGTLWLNMGDGFTSGDRKTWRSGVSDNKGHSIQNNMPRPKTVFGLKPKDLIGQPWRLAFALQADGWYLRSDIIWHKPNPMPESVTDRPTKAHEYLFLLTKSPRYYYDADAVREEGSFAPGHKRRAFTSPRAQAMGRLPSGNEIDGWVVESGFRNLRDVWTIPTHAYPEAHFATFPPRLIEPCVKAGTSEKGCCSECGAPLCRQTIVKYDNPGNRTTNGKRSLERRDETCDFPVRLEKNVTTNGWSPSCDCNASIVPGTVLDPFGGAGTTGLVAALHGRAAILIELNPQYVELARRRIEKEVPMLAEVVA